MDAKREESATESYEETPHGSGLLMWGLAAALLALNLQMMPKPWKTMSSFFSAVLSAIDVRQWSASTWLNATILMVAVLVVIRFGPDVKRGWVRYRLSVARKRAQAAQERERLQETEQRRREHEHAEEIRKNRYFRRYW